MQPRHRRCRLDSFWCNAFTTSPWLFEACRSDVSGRVAKCRNGRHAEALWTPSSVPSSKPESLLLVARQKRAPDAGAAPSVVGGLLVQDQALQWLAEHEVQDEHAEEEAADEDRQLSQLIADESERADRP